jgi:extracellular factor (EF) 3-hydroxypalmitic acid methyl ester biosynthesis protein
MRSQFKIHDLLDQVAAKVEAGHAHFAMRMLCESLGPVRAQYSDAQWTDIIKMPCLNHPVRDLFHQCPLTYRAFTKPRGYAGDADMLDLIYDQRPKTKLSSIGETIFPIVSRFVTGTSVSLRRDIMAHHIDEIASIRAMPSVMSLACGHLREAERSVAVNNGKLAKLLAVDQDRHSLHEVAKKNEGGTIEARYASVGEIVKGRQLGSFDLIYSGGLYDYLDDQTAVALTMRLFNMLNPGGRLILANFTPTNYGRPYMETFMDWHLNLRSPEALSGMRIACKSEEIQHWFTYSDPYGTIAYLQVERRN